MKEEEKEELKKLNEKYGLALKLLSDKVLQCPDGFNCMENNLIEKGNCIKCWDLYIEKLKK